MELVRWQPFAGLSNLHSVFDDLFDGTMERAPAQRNLAKWHPPVDVLESKDAYLIRAELPGMKKEDIKLEVKDGSLVLSGEIKTEKPAEGAQAQRGAQQAEGGQPGQIPTGPANSGPARHPFV